ncbi:MAG: hypothetical protein ACM3ZQ_04910 [Bacillota bacterium]
MRHIEPITWQFLQEDRLGDQEMNAVMEHLAECPDCQERYLEEITPRCEELAELLISDDFTAETMARITAHQAAPSLPKVAPLAPSVVRSRLAPTRQLGQRLAAYAVAASLTMALMVGGVFAQLSSLPRLQVEPPVPAAEPDEHPLAPSPASLGPLLPNDSAIPAARAPISIPPLRLLVERSITHGSKK